MEKRRKRQEHRNSTSQKNARLVKVILTGIIALVLILGGCGDLELLEDWMDWSWDTEAGQDMEDVGSSFGEYSGEAYETVDGNQPNFTRKERQSTKAFEEYSPLDRLGRCGTAFANVGKELMPEGERESISHIKPTGWQSVKYRNVEGRYLYNRCHLIGYQLTGENANRENLITGTRYMNTEGMLPFENQVADYVKDTGNHVLYRVTPVFEGDDLVAKGVEMEAYSVEDQGDGVCFHVFVYNIQPGISIDYATGDSRAEEN